MAGAVAIVAALVAAVLLWPSEPRPGGAGEPAAGGGSGAPHPGPEGPLEALRAKAPAVDAGLPAATAAAGRVVATFGWGSGEGDLGRHRPGEGNPEAPMSVTTDPAGNTWVLDQVNQRLVKLDRSGKRQGTVPLPVQAAQDVAVAQDGTVAVMDRLVDRSVALVGPDGKPLGELRLEGKGLPEGGGVTGVFTDGDKVFAEREHGDLVTLGTTKGVSDPERGETPGRPSRDGTSYLTAGLTNAEAGQVAVTVVERAGFAHRFTRQYSLGSPLLAITLLDSDRSGVIYLGLLGQTPQSTPEVPRFGITVLCLDPLDGRPLGRATLPANESADETFRELTVPDEGGVLYLHRTEQGAQLERYSCS